MAKANDFQSIHSDFVSYSQPLRRKWKSFRPKKAKTPPTSISTGNPPEEDGFSRSIGAEDDFEIRPSKKPRMEDNMQSSMDAVQTQRHEFAGIGEDIVPGADENEIDRMVSEWEKQRKKDLPVVPFEAQNEKVINRKDIPGPAGSPTLERRLNSGSLNHKEEMGSSKEFGEQNWLEATKTLENEYEPLVAKICEGLYSFRIPHICVLVDTLRATPIDNYFSILKDPSGSVDATVTPEVASLLDVGSVITLKDVWRVFHNSIPLTMVQVPILRDYEAKCHLVITNTQIVKVFKPSKHEVGISSSSH